LLYIGCTQITRKNIKNNDNSNTHYYHPNGTTDGAFAVGIDSSIYDQLLIEINKMVMPFDSGPLKTIQRMFTNQCYVMQPYLIIADLKESDCRGARNQEDASHRIGWKLSDFDKDAYITNRYYPLVSIIMTVSDNNNSNNNFNYFQSSIASLLSQTYRNLEIIVVVNANSANSADIKKYLKELASNDKRIVVINNSHQLGEVVCRNIGILVSHGKYITFQDAQYISMSTRIEKQVNLLKSSASGALGFKCSGCTVKYGNGKSQCLNTLMIVREVINDYGYFDCVKRGANLEYISRMTACGSRIGAINDIYYMSVQGLNTANKQDVISAFDINDQRYTSQYTAYHRLLYQDNMKVSSGINNSNAGFGYIASSRQKYMSFPLNKRLFQIDGNNIEDCLIYKLQHLIN
jgi:glycosyltransferase involved in cell wall biosynthesis